MSGYILDCRKKQSFPAFWILGSLVGLGFILMGGCIIYSFLNAKSSDRVGDMLFAGITTVIMGVLLLTGVIVTLIIMHNPGDLSFMVDINKVQGSRKYDANKLVNYIERCNNNVLLFNSDEGQMRVFGGKDKLIVEVCISSQDRFFTYHLTNPSVTDETPVIVGNIFFERFPTRKNRIVNNSQAVKAIEKLYESKRLSGAVASLPFIDSTEETKRLIENDAYITPSVPFVFHKKQKDIDRAVKVKEEREKRALQVLNEL